ncbi:MAG: hypothetical protein N2322_03310 [Terrimicrobiaceae bacterium]|nr:hypothetical protein [Terrimicrobiaceae bacterium]
MKTPTLLLAVAAAASAQAPAQTQDQKMLDRVTAIPNMRLVNPMQTKKFEGGAGLEIKKARGMNREVMTSSAAFSDTPARPTRSFLGIRNPWLGKLIYPAGTAWLPAGTVPRVAETIPTRKFQAKEYFDASKTEPAAARAVPVRAYSGRGGAQGALDLIGEAARRELTPDELRELLNKPR